MSDPLNPPPKEISLPPGLDPTQITCGFDVTTWSFNDARMFTLTYKNQDRAQGIGYLNIRRAGAEQMFDIPDGMTAHYLYKVGRSEVQVFHGTYESHEKEFSVSVEASIGMPKVSASVSTSLATTSKVDTTTDHSTSLVSSYKVIYDITRDGASELTQPFKADLDALTGEDGSSPKFDAFFQRWGTHYLTHGAYGGHWVMSTNIDEKVFERLSSEEIKVGISTSFEAGAIKGGGKSDIRNATKDALKVTDKEVDIDFFAVGGNSGLDLSLWLDTVDTAPMLLNEVLSVTAKERTLRPKFRPVWDLAPDALKPAMLMALERYVGPAVTLDHDLLEPSVPVIIDKNTKAPSDGFLTAMAGGPPDGGDYCALLYLQSDKTDQPARLLGTTTMCHVGSPKFAFASAFIPVRADDYYIVDYGRDRGEVPVVAGFQPFPLSFGEPEPLNFNTLYDRREADGFVLVTLRLTTSNICWAIARGQQMVRGALTTCATASTRSQDHVYIYTSSFCMPVPLGNEFKIDLQTEGGPSIAEAWWIPIGNTYKMSPLKTYKFGEINQTHENGVLFAIAEDPQQEDLGEVWLVIQASDDPLSVPYNTLARNALLPALSPFASVAAILRKGMYFSARSMRSGTAWWTAITRRDTV